MILPFNYIIIQFALILKTIESNGILWTLIYHVVYLYDGDNTFGC